jgi:hypothetical protein
MKQKKRDSAQDGKIKELEKRVDEAQKQSPNNRAQDLKGSLVKGGPMVRQEYDRDFQRLGPRFAQGDCMTLSSSQRRILTV